MIADHSQRHAVNGVLVHLNKLVEGIEVPFKAELDESLFVLGGQEAVLPVARAENLTYKCDRSRN